MICLLTVLLFESLNTTWNINKGLWQTSTIATQALISWPLFGMLNYQKVFLLVISATVNTDGLFPVLQILELNFLGLGREMISHKAFNRYLAVYAKPFFRKVSAIFNLGRENHVTSGFNLLFCKLSKFFKTSEIIVSFHRAQKISP